MNNKELAGLLRKAACRADIEMNGVDGAYVVSRISTVIDALEKAAEGVEPVATVLRHRYTDSGHEKNGFSCADWERIESLEAGTKLYTTPPAPAVSVPDGWHLVPPGWRVVPEFPTDDMMIAGLSHADYHTMMIAGLSHADYHTAYQAMLAAAPQPESSE